MHYIAQQEMLKIVWSQHRQLLGLSQSSVHVQDGMQLHNQQKW